MSIESVVESAPIVFVAHRRGSEDLYTAEFGEDRYRVITKYGSWGQLTSQDSKTRITIDGPLMGADPILLDLNPDRLEITLTEVRSREETIAIALELAQILHNHRDGKGTDGN